MKNNNSNIVSLKTRVPKATMRCTVKFRREGPDAIIEVDPPSFLDTTEGRELLADYCTSLVEQIFDEDERVRQLFLPK